MTADVCRLAKVEHPNGKKDEEAQVPHLAVRIPECGRDINVDAFVWWNYGSGRLSSVYFGVGSVGLYELPQKHL